MAEFRRTVEALPAEDFRRGAGHALLWMWGHVRKVQNALDVGDEARAAQAAEWGGYVVAAFVALVNKRYYTHSDLRWLKESASFPLLPRDFEVLMRKAHLARRGKEILAAYPGLWRACETLASAQGISMESHDDLGSVGL